MRRLELHIEVTQQAMENQQARADTAKIAATLLATAGPAIGAVSLARGTGHLGWRTATVAGMIGTVFAAVLVFLLDQRTRPDPLEVVAASHGVSDDQIERDLRREMLVHFVTNEVGLRNSLIALYAEVVGVLVILAGACFLLPN